VPRVAKSHSSEGNQISYKIFVDDFSLLFYYPRNTGKEVIRKYMSSNHSEVAET